MRNDSLHKILYVEDDADIRKIVSMSLEMVGDYTVAACGSFSDAHRWPPFSESWTIVRNL